MRWPVVALVLLAGCTGSAPEAPPDGPSGVEEDRPLPAHIDLNGSFSGQSDGIYDGRCPFTGDCVLHDIVLEAAATMGVELNVDQGSLQWTLWKGQDQLMDEAVSGHWTFERHFAAGSYQLVLHSAGHTPAEATGGLSWSHAFPPEGNATPPPDILKEGTWPAGQTDVYVSGDCLTCDVHPFNVTGSGYGTVTMSARLDWGDRASWGGLRLLQDGNVVASATAGIPSEYRVLEADLFPGEYGLEMSGNSPQGRSWTLTVGFT